MRLGFHSVFEHRLLNASESRAGNSKISVSEREDERGGDGEMASGIVAVRYEVLV
jgi:hypothetical protein